ncbi:hypothetical protein K439DRAFT_1266864, partial [Ramaria rubella]
NYLGDLKAAKTDIISQHNCPILPDGLWTNILANCFVDLDKVHTSYYMLKADHKHTQSIGDHAILFAYPHRADKLFEYKEFIIGHFAPMDDITTHYKVINLDKLIRMRISRSNSFSL